MLRPSFPVNEKRVPFAVPFFVMMLTTPRAASVP
jgi:hypothetical protein